MKAETQSGFHCVSSIQHRVYHIITIQTTDSLYELTNDKITMPIQTFSSCLLAGVPKYNPKYTCIGSKTKILW